MNRFWVRTTVFCGLLGAAGVLWGVAASRFPIYTLLAPELDRSAAVCWSALASLCAVIAAAWISIRTVTPTGMAALRSVALVLVFLGWWALPASIALSLSCDGPVAPIAMMFLPYALAGVPGIVYLVKTRPAWQVWHRQASPTIDWRAMALTSALFLAAAALCWGTTRGDGPLLPWSAISGFSVVAASQFGDLGQIHYLRWFIQSLAMGGLYGMVLCTYLRASGPASSLKPILSFAMIGYAIGAIVSGLMFEAHAVTLLRSVSRAYEPHATLQVSVALWGILGIMSGIFLAGMLERKVAGRSRRTASLISLASVLAVLLSICAWRYITIANGGHELLTRASYLENRVFMVGFGLQEHRRPMIRQGNVAVRISATGSYAVERNAYSCTYTVRLCDELLTRFPHSAYKPGSLYLKGQSAHLSWEPAFALETFRTLQSEYPWNGYDLWKEHQKYEVCDLLLTGQYQEVLRATRSLSAGRSIMTLLGMRAIAAEVLGRWDVAVDARKEILRLDDEDRKNWSRRDPEYVSRLRRRLHDAEAHGTRHAPPMKLAGISGRVLWKGRPLPHAKVGLAVAGRISSDHVGVDPLTLAACRGRIASTDSQGVYRINGMPEGKYEVLLLLDPDAVHLPITVHAPSVPYDIRGETVRLPDIVLAPKPGK